MQPSEELAGKAFQLWCALSDAIEERERYRAALEEIRRTDASCAQAIAYNALHGSEKP